VVESVEEDQVNHLWAGHLKLGKHVKGDKSGQTKRSGLEEMRKGCDAPSQDFYVCQLLGPLESPEGNTVLTLRLKELELPVKKLQVWFGEDNLRSVDITRIPTDIAGFCLKISGVDSGLCIRGVVRRQLGRHPEWCCDELFKVTKG
jgi:hypothetical protein